MKPPSHRIVLLTLATTDGRILGDLPEFSVEVPWLQETLPVVEAARCQFGIDVLITRILSATRTDEIVSAHYLAEYTGGVLPDLATHLAPLHDDPQRLFYAQYGGASRERSWAEQALREHGFELRNASQIRTWNLSSIWRLDCEEQQFWLKSVPPFFAHEGALLELLAGEAVPTVLHREGARCLMQSLPGEDGYNASYELIEVMVGKLVALQAQWAPSIPEMLALGVPDHREDAMLALIDRAIDVHIEELETDEQALLHGFRRSLPEQLQALGQCGLPYSLVHGDYHPGNWRGEDGHFAILDWGDSVVGHPMLDVPALLRSVAADRHTQLLDCWARAWHRYYPAADVERCVALILPIASLRMAGIYQHFLDNIEHTEHVYHRDDPVAMLRNACSEIDR